MSASKRRPLWQELPAEARARIEQLVDGRVVAAVSCPSGFSPGFASRLRLADGRRVFVKAIDGQDWPDQVDAYRAEAQVAAALPAEVPAPGHLGSTDDGRWVVLAFDELDGHEPAQPWQPAELERAVDAFTQLSQAVTPSPVALPHEHPRLGGWSALADDPDRVARLPTSSRWAAEHVTQLVDLEHEGLSAARGDTLVHFDSYSFNLILTSDRVYVVDWPHARLGAPYLELLLLLSSAAADGINPELWMHTDPLTTSVDPHEIDAVLAAHAGFCLNGALDTVHPGLQPIVDAKHHLAHGALSWLQHRLDPGRPRG